MILGRASKFTTPSFNGLQNMSKISTKKKMTSNFPFFEATFEVISLKTRNENAVSKNKRLSFLMVLLKNANQQKVHDTNVKLAKK